jgi:glycosyltransferase involved in cell wall biosynthesis
MPSPRSVLVVVENHPVPFDRRVWMECRALAEAGYDVSVISPKGKGAESHREVLEGIHVYRHDMPLEADSPRGYLREYSAALWAEWRLAGRVRRERGFQVMQVCNPPDMLFIPALWFKALYGTRLIFDHHDLSPELYEAKYGRRDAFYHVLRLAERLTFAAADVVIATNESYRAIATMRGHRRPDDVIVVRNGTDLSRFVETAADPAYKRGRRFLVGYVGTMGEQEGIDYLLRAVRIIVRDMGRDDIGLCIIGGGPAVQGLRRLSADLGVSDFIEFPGRVSDKELLARLSTCDLCVNPDPKTPFNDASTMTKIMDYMALGKASVQFDLVEGRRSAEEASVYARGDDEADLARLMVELLNDEERRARMGRIGRARMETSLEWRHQIPRLLAAYERALGKYGDARQARRRLRQKLRRRQD